MSRNLYIIAILLLLLCPKNNAQSFGKAALSNDKFYLPSISGDSINFIKIIDTKKIMSPDSLYLRANLTKSIGAFYSNPISWDIIGDYLYIVDTYEDHLGMNYAQLKMFDVSEIQRLKLAGKDSLNNYINSSKRIKSRPISPIEKYSIMSRYNTGNVQGKIYFDMVTSADHLWVYVYLDSIKRMEVWEFTRYPIIQKYISNTDKDEITRIYKQKPWEKVSSMSIEIACPFRVFNINQKDYLIVASGQSYQLQGKNIEKTNMEPIQNMENSILIINKNTDELLLIPENKFLEKSSLSVKDKITKFSKKIKVNK
jgi:hypothetical protein